KQQPGQVLPPDQSRTAPAQNRNRRLAAHLAGHRERASIVIGEKKSMPLSPRLSSLWRNLFHKARKDQELAEEIDAYLEMLIDQKINEGLNREEARRAALIELAGKEQGK